MWRIAHNLIALIGLGFVVAMAYNFVAQQNSLSEFTAVGVSDFDVSTALLMFGPGSRTILTLPIRQGLPTIVRHERERNARA
jgi:hypothetical protein